MAEVKYGEDTIDGLSVECGIWKLIFRVRPDSSVFIATYQNGVFTGQEFIGVEDIGPLIECFQAIKEKVE